MASVHVPGLEVDVPYRAQYQWLTAAERAGATPRIGRPLLPDAWALTGQQMDPRNPAMTHEPAPTDPPLLVLTTVDRRENAASQPVRADSRAFVYGGLNGHSPLDETVHPFQPYEHPFRAGPGIYGQGPSQAAHLRVLPWLCAIFDSEDIGRVLAPSTNQNQPTVTLQELAHQRRGSIFLTPERREFILGSAKVRFDPATSTLNDALQRWRVPSYLSLFESTPTYGQYIRVDRERTKYDGHWSTVAEYTRKEGQQEKAYRFLFYPEAVGDDEMRGMCQPIGENISRTYQKAPTQSVFLNPFYWHASQGCDETQYAAAPLRVQPPVLTEPRFIVVADEFSTRAAMMDRNSYYDTVAGRARKPGLTARTVYEINAWGYVLKSRRWEYKADSATVAMKGILPVETSTRKGV